MPPQTSELLGFHLVPREERSHVRADLPAGVSSQDGCGIGTKSRMTSILKPGPQEQRLQLIQDSWAKSKQLMFEITKILKVFVTTTKSSLI